MTEQMRLVPAPRPIQSYSVLKTPDPEAWERGGWKRQWELLCSVTL